MQNKDRAVEKLSLQSAIHYYLKFWSEWSWSNNFATTRTCRKATSLLLRDACLNCACASEKVFLTNGFTISKCRSPTNYRDIACQHYHT